MIRRAPLAAMALALAACPKRAPTVNFHSDVHTVAVEPAADASNADGALSVVRFEPVEGTAVTGDGRTLLADGATATCDEGARFTAYLRVDLDGDSAPDGLVVARTGLDNTARPPAVLRRQGNVWQSLPVADANPTESRCATSALRQTSPRSVTVSFRCEPAVQGASLAEEQLLLALSATPAVKQRASLAAGALADTALTLRLEGVDLDGDGRDEVSVGLSAGRPGAPQRASARVTFFERAGALARDTSEPSTSLQANPAAARRSLSSGRNGALEALATLDDYERLRRAFCADSAMARVRFQGSTGFDCGGAPTNGAADLYARAWINAGETPAAEAQLRAETAGPFGVVTSERVQSDLDRASLTDRTVTARNGPAAGAVLDAIVPAHQGALAFDRATAPTQLTLRGPAGGSLDVATLTLSPGAPGSASDVLVRSPDGVTAITGFVERCDGVAVVRCPTANEACVDAVISPASTALPAGAEATTIPWLPSRAMAQRCLQDVSAMQGLAPSAAHALGWGRDGLVVAVHGVVHRVAPAGVTRLALNESPGAGFAAGAAVSPNGAAMAMPGLSGVWVRERNAWRRWSPASLTGRFATLTDLTPTNDARALAAMAGTEVWLLERPRATRR